MPDDNWKKQVLITTRFGKYVWYPPLELIDFIETGKKRSNNIIYLLPRENTELGAMLKATNDMLKKLREVKKKRADESTETL